MDQTDLTTLERAITERLRAQITGIDIGAFPDNAEAYRLTHQVGALLVAYHGASYGPLLDTEAVVQERTPAFDVNVVTRGLAGHQGAYVYLEAVRQALTGYRIPGCGKLRPVREQFIGQKAGVWTYAIRFALTTVALEVDDVADAPGLAHVTVISDFTTSEIPTA